MSENHWYLRSAEQALNTLRTGAEGLSNTEGYRRLRQNGPNRISITKDHSLWTLFFHQFVSFFVIVLFAAAVIKFFLREYLDMIVLLITLFVLILIGFFQEMKAERALRALQRMSAHKTKVKRDGKFQTIDSESLVVGDIIMLEAGDKVPADARLIQVQDLQVNESMLSGESMPSEKHTNPLSQECGLADRKNMVYSGTVISSGKSVAVVTAVGSATELGKIASSIAEVEMISTPLQKDIQSVVKFTVLMICVSLILLVAIGLHSGIGFTEILLLSIAAAVSAMPEGLHAAFTVTLASGMHLMAQRKAIIRKLSAVETLGSTTVICSDKTGTLTCNKMTVTALYADGQILPIEKADPGTNSAIQRCFMAAVLCNDALIAKNGDVMGEPTEAALLTAAVDAGMTPPSLQKEFPRKAEIAFMSENRYMATAHGKIAFVKGAPEQILAMSQQMLTKDGIVPLNQAAVHKAVEEMTQQALRLIAVAWCEIHDGMSELQETALHGKLIFGGIFGMMDPPRPEVIQAIAKCNDAGVRVVMATGDNPMTASAIAKALGIHSDETITGQMLHELSDAELQQKITHASVFARVEPVHKLRIVQAFQANKEVVAMTGDGINDAPALEAANIGIAMGLTGTDVAKEAADMVLADDRFDSIVAAIEEGRAIFQRLRNICALLLLTCYGELFGLILSVFVMKTAPLLPLQIIWINLVSGAMISVPLAFEPKTGQEMKRPPRPHNCRLLYAGMIYRISIYALMLGIGSFLIFFYSLEHMDLSRARTMVLCSLLFAEWVITLKMRSDEVPLRKLGFNNPILFLAIGAAILLHMCILYIPSLQQLFHTEPLTWREWLIVSVPGLTIFSLEEMIRKEFFPLLFSKGKWR